MDAQQLQRLLTGWVEGTEGNLVARLTLALRHAINSGVLRNGERLPDERSLAAALSVSRPTLVNALASLRDEGLLRSRQGSGSWVTSTPSSDDETLTPFSELSLDERGINLAGAYSYDASHLPNITLTSADLLEASPSHGISPLGSMPLRAAAAERSSRFGAAATVSDVVITAGAHQGIRLALETCTRPGDRLVIDEYAYGGLLRLARRQQLTLIPVRSDEFGADPEHLDHCIKTSRPALVATGSTIHSPTGRRITPERQGELAEVLNRHHQPTVIDETYAELDYLGRPASLNGLLTAPNMTLESLSKSVWTGLRLGWMTTSTQLAKKITAERAAYDLGLSVASQLFALEVLATYEQLLHERRRSLAAKSRHLQILLSESQLNWQSQLPDGGVTTWVTTSWPATDEYVEATRLHGVTVVPGSACRPDARPDPHLRLCHDRPLELLDRAIPRLESSARMARSI